MNLPTLFRRRSERNVVAAACPSADGLAVVKVRREPDLPPVLEFCEFHAGTAAEDGAALRRMLKSRGMDRSQCNSTMELGSYNLLLAEAPDVQPDELRSAIRWRIKDLIDFHIDDAVVDVFEVPGQKAAGKNKVMYAVVARVADVRALAERLTALGLKLDVIDIPELALRNLAALLPEDVGGVVLVYVGQTRGLITISRQQTLYLSRRVEIGLGSLPETAMHADAQDVIEDWLDRIIIEVQRSLDYYESNFSQPRVSGVVICPVGRELPGASEYVSRELAIPTRMLDINEIIDVAEPLDGVTQAKCLLAVGAALRMEIRAL